MLGASVGFAVMGLLVKGVSATVPTVEVVFWRTLLTALVVAAVAVARCTSLRPTNVRMQGVRALVGLASMSLYFFSISRLRLGDAVLLTYLSPILVAACSPWVTGEAVSRRVWAASALGFVGVALVARPGVTTDWLGIGAAVVAAGFAASAYLSVRVLTRTDGPDVIVFWFSVVGALVAGVPAVFDGLVVPTPGVGAELLSMGLVGAVAQGLMTRSYSRGSAATMSIYSYATPVFAYALGFVFRHEVPPITSLLGAACVVGAGVVAARG